MWHPRWNGSKWQAQIGRELVGIHHASIVQSMILWLYFFGEISTAMTHSEGHLNKYISSGGQPNADLKPLLNILYSFRPTNQWAEKRTLHGIVHRFDNGPISIDHMDFMQD